MNSDITVYNYNKPRTLVLGKISKITNEIVKAKSVVKAAKDRAILAQREYDNTAGIHIFRKSKLKKEYQRAMDDLTIANSEAIIQNLKIMGYIIELIPLCFCIPMDLIQRTVLWVTNGFSERDKRFTSFAKKTIPLFEQSKRPQKSGINISRGFSRLFIVCIVVAIAAFGIHKAMHKKDATNTISTTNSQINQAESIEAVKNMMAGLKSRISTLKETFFGSPVTDEEIYFEAIEPEYSMEAGTNVSPEEIEDAEKQQTSPEILEQKTVADENKLETSDTISQTENSTELSGKSSNE